MINYYKSTYNCTDISFSSRRHKHSCILRIKRFDDGEMNISIKVLTDDETFEVNLDSAKGEEVVLGWVWIQRDERGYSSWVHSNYDYFDTSYEKWTNSELDSTLDTASFLVDEIYDNMLLYRNSKK